MKPHYPDASLKKALRRIEKVIKSLDDDLPIQSARLHTSPSEAAKQAGFAIETIIEELFAARKHDSKRNSLREKLEFLEAHHRKAERSGSSEEKKLASEFLRITRYLWHIHQSRNWVSHQGRQVSWDDAAEILRMLAEVLEWRNATASARMDKWEPRIALHNVTVTDSNLPSSVTRLRTAFERAYQVGDWKALSQCLHPDYGGSLFEETSAEELVEAIRVWHDESGGSGAFLVDVKLIEYELCDDGKLWWHVDLNIRSSRPGTLARFPQRFWIHLVDLQANQARILAAAPC